MFFKWCFLRPQHSCSIISVSLAPPVRARLEDNPLVLAFGVASVRLRAWTFVVALAAFAVASDMRSSFSASWQSSCTLLDSASAFFCSAKEQAGHQIALHLSLSARVDWSRRQTLRQARTKDFCVMNCGCPSLGLAPTRRFWKYYETQHKKNSVSNNNILDIGILTWSTNLGTLQPFPCQFIGSLGLW